MSFFLESRCILSFFFSHSVSFSLSFSLSLFSSLFFCRLIHIYHASSTSSHLWDCKYCKFRGPREPVFCVLFLSRFNVRAYLRTCAYCIVLEKKCTLTRVWHSSLVTHTPTYHSSMLHVPGEYVFFNLADAARKPDVDTDRKRTFL